MVNNVIKLIDFAELFDFTNGKIYMFGWSRGAMQTYIVLSRDSRIDAAVAGAGPTDIARSYNERSYGMRQVYINRIGGPPDAYPDEYATRSAVCWPDAIDTPLFIVHGTSDERVDASHSIELYDAMHALGKDVRLSLYPDMDHSDPSWAFMSDYFYWLKQH